MCWKHSHNVKLTSFMKTAAMIVIKKATETVTIVGIAQRGRESFCSSSFRASTAFFSAKFAIPEDIVFDRAPGVGPVDNFPEVGHSVVVVVPDVGDPVADNVGDPKVDIAPNSENSVVDIVPEAGDTAVDSDPLVGDCVSNNIRNGIILFSFSCSYITFSNNRNSWSGVSAKTGEKKIRLLNGCSSKMSLSIHLHYIFFALRAKTVATC